MTVATTTETVPGTVLAAQDVNVTNAPKPDAGNDLNNNSHGKDMGDSKELTSKDLDDYLHHYNKWQQSRFGRALQQWIADHLGLKFDAEIKWKNVLMIGGLHLTTVIMFFKYVWYSTLTTWLWGKCFRFSLHRPNPVSRSFSPEARAKMHALEKQITCAIKQATNPCSIHAEACIARVTADLIHSLI